MSAGGDAEESNGKGDFAPAGGEDGKEARDVAEEENVVEIFGRDLVVVLAVSKGGADGEKGTVGGESELHPGDVQISTSEFGHNRKGFLHGNVSAMQ